jgi:hypothetical protein
VSERRIELIGYPVKLGARSDEHVSDWLREFKLIAFAADNEAEQPERPHHQPPEQLVALAEQLRTVYASEISEPERERERAYAEGRATVDVSFPIIPETEPLARAWRDVMAQVDELCAAQELLTLARPPELKQLTDWVFDEFIRQAHGEPPRPWSGPLA